MERGPRGLCVSAMGVVCGDESAYRHPSNGLTERMKLAEGTIPLCLKACICWAADAIHGHVCLFG